MLEAAATVVVAVTDVPDTVALMWRSSKEFDSAAAGKGTKAKDTVVRAAASARRRLLCRRKPSQRLERRPTVSPKWRDVRM